MKVYSNAISKGHGEENDDFEIILFITMKHKLLANSIYGPVAQLVRAHA